MKRFEITYTLTETNMIKPPWEEDTATWKQIIFAKDEATAKYVANRHVELFKDDDDVEYSVGSLDFWTFKVVEVETP